MKYWILIWAMSLGLVAPAQNSQLLEGTVTDGNQPIPYAHVRFKEQVFTITDAEGKFLLSIPGKHLRDTLSISAMGFITYHLPLNTATPGQPITISLQPETYLLDGVTISKNKARNHWLKALQKLQNHLPSTAYTYPAFYRQMHQENGTYVRLIEAGMTVYDVAASYRAGVMQERFSLQQVRRSNVWERNGDDHGDHLVDMFMENNLRYPAGTIMDTKALAQFEVSFDDANCTICGDSLEMLSYHYQRPGDPKVLDGHIWLYLGTMALHSLEETATQNPDFVERGMSMGGGNHHWMFQESQKTLQFVYYDGAIYLNTLQFEYLHHIQDRQVGMMRYEVTEGFALYCGPPTTYPDGYIPDNTFARSGNLYSRKYQYQPSFWEQFSLANENPLPPTVVQTFSSKIPLYDQFKKNGE